jgi:cytochrome P450|tara:strand:+ start:15845 stop:17023 length:1179 start_codon:yes stop_codon:yes gene_type:complete
MSVQRIESDLELYSDEALENPYPIYKELRDLEGPVWLNAHGVYVLSKYDHVRTALENGEVFSSASGVSLNDFMNKALAGGLLCSNSPEHDVLRKIIERPVLPKQLNALRQQIVEEAERHVEQLVKKDQFEVITELAQHLPVTIVSNLVGLPETGREKMLDWAPANFNCFGPEDNELTQSSFPILEEMVKYALEECVPGKLKPGGWAAQIWEAADRGEISHATCPKLMNDYMGPSLDTTIFATASAIWLFSQNTKQWDILRANPGLIPNAINEVVRIESPVTAFSRMTTRDFEMEGHTIPEGSRVIVLYGSANRDERHWGNPETFDIQRSNVAEHMGFGFGEHQCVGNNLARLEIRSLLTALIKHVERFELIDIEWAKNNALRGIARCNVAIH